MARGAAVIRLGRYELAGQLATGGMAAVHLGRIRGAQGFSRVVVIKRILPEFARKPDFVRMFVNEAHLAARVRHPSVVATLDAVEHGHELLLVMEFVHGLSLAKLVSLASGERGRIPLRIAAAIVAASLRGLHAAHEAKDELGRPLTIVHRDVSPQNILVGRDGLARVLDFGIAKAVDQTRSMTVHGEFKGKMTYAAPEQVLFQDVSRATDIFAAGLVLWELATGQRRYGSSSHGAIIKALIDEPVPMPSSIDPGLPRALDRIIYYATQKNPSFRYRAATDMARELEEHIGVATPPEIAAWLGQVAAPELARLDAVVASVETMSDVPADDLAMSSPTILGSAPTELDETSQALGPPQTRSSRRPSLGPRRWTVPLFGSLAGAATVLVVASVLAPARGGKPSLSPRHDSVETLSSASFASVPLRDARSAESTPTPPAPRSPNPAASSAAPPDAAAPPPADCTPPYYFDPVGIKHVKIGCG